MLKYKRTDVVVYFSHKELEYRRVDGCWEVYLDNMWMMSKDCESIEMQYKKRTNLRNLIKRKIELTAASDYNQISPDSENEISVIVKTLMDTLGIGIFMDNTSKQLLDKLDSGEILVK